MGGFYKILVGTTKLTLRNINLTSLIEVEQVINTRSLVYVDNNLDNHKHKRRYPSTDSKEWRWKIDQHYHVEEMNTVEKLLETWKNGLTYWAIWELWKNHFQFKKKPIVQQSHESAVSKKPRIGDRVQVKGSSPRGTLKVDRVIEMIENQDGKEEAATVMVPNKSIFQKSIIHMYPLEFNDEEQL